MKRKKKKFDVLIYQMEVEGENQTLIESQSFLNWLRDNGDAEPETQDFLNDFASGLEAQLILASSFNDNADKIQ